jgi:iron-sulfur cluster repair protein YtfE (RIC family)
MRGIPSNLRTRVGFERDKTKTAAAKQSFRRLLALLLPKNNSRSAPEPSKPWSRVAMSAPAEKKPVFEQMHEEHDSLREKLGQIHDVFQNKTPAPTEIKSLLHEFEVALVVHFSHEENEGFFDDVTSHSPALAAEAERLCYEHAELKRDAAELCRFASSGSPSLPWWRELASRCHAFSQKLMHHESAENRLLQIAYREEHGVVD